MSGCSTPKTVSFQVPAYTPPQPVSLPALSAYACGSDTSEVVLCWYTEDAYSSYVVRDSYTGTGGFNVGDTNTAHLTGLPAGVTVTAQVAGVTPSGQQGPWSNEVTMQTQPSEILQVILSIISCNVTYAQAGDYIQAQVTVNNTGTEAGSDTLSATMTRTDDGSYAGHFNPVSVSVGPGGQQTYTMQSAGTAGSQTVGVEFEVIFNLQASGVQCVSYFTMG